MSRRYPFFFLSLLVSCFLLACQDESYGPDTCTEGDNMTNPRLVNGLESDEEGPFVRITWDDGTGRGADLPERYFDEVEVREFEASRIRRTHEDAVGVGASAERTDTREITLDLEDTPEGLAAVTLAFPDRAGFIDCTHPGMADHYLLDVLLEFDGAGGLISSILRQIIDVGDI